MNPNLIGPGDCSGTGLDLFRRRFTFKKDPDSESILKLIDKIGILVKTLNSNIDGLDPSQISTNFEARVLVTDMLTDLVLKENDLFKLFSKHAKITKKVVGYIKSTIMDDTQTRLYLSKIQNTQIYESKYIHKVYNKFNRLNSLYYTIVYDLSHITSQSI
jgi:hypothetical protein